EPPEQDPPRRGVRERDAGVLPSPLLRRSPAVGRHWRKTPPLASGAVRSPLAPGGRVRLVIRSTRLPRSWSRRREGIGIGRALERLFLPEPRLQAPENRRVWPWRSCRAGTPRSPRSPLVQRPQGWWSLRRRGP